MEVGEFVECSCLYAGDEIFLKIPAHKRGFNTNVSVGVNHRTKQGSLLRTQLIDFVSSVLEQQ